ncbi:TBCC domain-containing protein 1-like [Oscarella lobularis]|uniref:TBCC domain-containing protein 1-like n=1 Tax=Oscarella lobularis TaxID=121494 RepID=UPI0033144C8C
MDTIDLWANPWPIDFGICQIPPPTKFSAQYLHKLASYAKSKGTLGWPYLRYDVWKRFATTRLHLNEEQIQMYFDAFLLLVSTKRSLPDRIQWYKQYASAKVKSERDGLLDQRLVPTQQFVLFLYVQQSTKVSLKSKLVAGDEWKQSSPPFGQDSKSSSEATEEMIHFRFVHDNLQEILQLLVEPDSVSDGSSALADQEIRMAGVEALEFLISGCSTDRSVKPLRELVSLQSQSSQCGYSKITQKFALLKLSNWIQSHLKPNPYGLSATRINSKVTERLFGQTEGASGKGRTASNRTIAPKKFRVTTFAAVRKLTVIQGEESLSDATVQVYRCRNAFLYLLAPLKHASIDNCRQVIIVLGAVEGVVSVTKCVQCTIIAICGNVHISDCSQCTFHVSCLARPILLARNEHLVLAPYHTHYPTLGEHVEKAGLTTTYNCWNNPIEFGLGTDEDTPPVYRLMPPSSFSPFVVPVTMDGPLKENPCPLPKEYRDAADKRDAIFKSWHKTVNDAHLDEDKKEKLQTFVEGQFQDWLTQTGNAMQLLT